MRIERFYFKSKDGDALDYYMIGVWLVKLRKYSDWSEEKLFEIVSIRRYRARERLELTVWRTIYNININTV